MTETSNNQLFNGKTWFSLAGLMLVLVILILLNVIISKANIRFDATKDKLYSLSDGTKTILSTLDQPVTIKVFFTKDHVNTPVHIKNYAQRLFDFLAEYEYYSKGKLKVESYNPQPDSEEEEWAQKYGIQGAMLPTGEKFYFGLVVTCMDQEDSIKMLDPAEEENLEYHVTRMITRVRFPEKITIGVLTGLGVFGQAPPHYNPQMPMQGTPPWTFITELKKTYNVKEIPSDTDSIDDDIALLMLIHPSNLTDKTQYAIDQFVLQGKNAIVMVDPFCFHDETPSQSKSSSLDKLFNVWGVAYDASQVLIDFNYATELIMQNNVRERNPSWLLTSEEAFNDSNIITGKLDTMLFPVAGAISLQPDSQVNYEPLVQSTKNSALEDGYKIRFGTQHLQRDFSPTAQVYDMAVKISGKFTTAFPQGQPKDEDQTDVPDYPHLTESQKNSTIIIIADADWIADMAYVRSQNLLGFNFIRIINDNLNFLLNSSELLTGSEALINIRSRGKFRRPFTRVQELEQQARDKWLEKEQELVREFEDMNRKLNELERQKDSSQRLIISAEQEQEIERFKDQKLKIQQDLKIVRRSLREDTEKLGTRIKIINIALMPAIVSLCGIFYALRRRQRISSS